MNDLVNLLVNNGVSVGMLCVMCWYVKYMTDKHTEEIKGFQDALNDLKKTINTLIRKIEKEGD